MTDETTAPQGGAAVAASNEPAQQPSAKPAPKNDAEAAQQEAAETVQEPSDAEKAAKVEADKQADEKKRNRTKAYIDRINGENAEMRRRLAEIDARQQQQRPSQPSQQRQEAPPTLEEHNFDFAAWTEANNAYQRQQWAKEQEQAATFRHQQETQAKYADRASAFADAHPDFLESVGSIDPGFLTAGLQAAIIGHEKGPEIAYFIANNEDALWNLASVREDLLPAAVDRLASRLGAAPPPAQQPPGIAPAPQLQPALQPKPISQAPAPVPTVGGRSPTETPQEKLTDDEWYRRDVERRRKR